MRCDRHVALTEGKNEIWRLEKIVVIPPVVEQMNAMIGLRTNT